MIISVLEPDYFEKFHCLASACRCDCCHGWLVTMGKAGYSKIRAAKASPQLAEKIKTGLIRNHRPTDPNQYAKTKMRPNGDCVFLDEKRLCSLQVELGPGILCNTCKDFPRRVRSMGGIVERSCNASCEGVIHLFWDAPQGLRFVEREISRSIRCGSPKISPALEPLTKRFLDIQRLSIAILQNREYSLDTRMILLGLAMQALNAVKSSEEIDGWLEKYRGLCQGAAFARVAEQMPSNPQLFVSNNIDTIRALLIQADQERQTYIRRLMQNLELQEHPDGSFTFQTDRYALLRERMHETADEYLLENIMVNEWFYNSAPLVDVENVWDSYIEHCLIYSLLKFMLACAMTDGAGKEEAVYAVVQWSRSLLHNRNRMLKMIRSFHDTGSDTLAHMAVLVNG